ncbi:beta-ketoacyl synthase N-terminal-like domain-containing protein [Aquabacterium sp.]|uniref:beta-ketoacyl synthase N-terminal-like domain-containing protein n=1 Tax=Aquabacterium sp. TaxID=1872578 RepID=UPI003784D794
MSEADVVIVSAGLITPIGLSLAETASSARARVARLREIEWRDRRFEPFIVGSVPEAGLPPLAEPLANAPLQYREARMLRLAHAALEEALAPLPPAARALPLLLGLPEHHTTMPLDPGRFLERLDQQVPGCIDVATSLAAPRGRAAGLLAIELAMARLAAGEHAFVLVGGVDCLVDLYVLGTLDLEGRIRNEAASDGFSPAEGAALLLLTRADTARSLGLAPLAALTASAHGHEEGHVYAEAPYLGEGLAATFAQLLAAPPARPIGSVYASFNGERYWAREFGVARLRQAQAFDPEHQMEHPAECFGDLGAAHGAALAALAAHGVALGYRRAPSLVYASSDRGERAAALVDEPS